MNNEENLISKLIALAAYYRETISADQLLMYAEDLQCLSLDELSLAIKLYRTNPKNKFFPLPAALISCVRETSSDEDESREAAAKIAGAISKFGWCNLNQTREYIGDIGWIAVEMNGGWLSLCSFVTDENKSTVSAQLRNLCETISKRKHFKQTISAIEYNESDKAISFDVFKKP